MPPLMYQFAGGSFFIPATLLLVAAVLIGSFSRGRWIALLSNLAAILAIALIAVSATALPWWFYGCWTAVTIVWFFVDLLKHRPVRIAIRVLVVIFTLSAATVELSHQQLPTLSTAAFSRMYVFGDSVTAGLGRQGETTWPVLLRADHSVRIVDFSRAGCTVGQALRTAKTAPMTDGIVLIEVGGNDMIGRTGARQFGADLDALVRTVQGSDRELVMFELPLFAFDNAYGIEQRWIAEKYGIRLIPRRFLAAILAAPGATVDGIHLSNTGQRALAALVWQVVGPALHATPRG